MRCSHASLVETGRKNIGVYRRRRYRKRHQMENFFEKIKRMRRIATGHDKSDDSFMAFVFILWPYETHFKTLVM